jgi:Flp pilus assembly protein TadD
MGSSFKPHPPATDVPVLWFHLCDPRALPPAQFSTRQLTLGPLMQDLDRDGTPVALRTPGGSYDLAEALAPVRGRFEPEIVLVYADASGTNLPRNLDAVPGVKVLVVGDTHHLANPLQRMLAYALSEPFDWIISPHNRHHLHFFVEAGFPSVAWLPNLLCDAPVVQAPPPSARRAVAVGSGQRGAMHPARAALVRRLERARVPYEHCVGLRDAIGEAYGSAAVSVNRSLNGDLNLRVSEVLAAGGCLATDALSPESGLGLLFESGREIETYATDAAAVELVSALIADPARATALATAGWRRYAAELDFKAQSRRLLRLITCGEVCAPFELSREPRCVEILQAAGPLRERLPLYEHAQELNRTREATVIGLAGDVDLATALDLVDLHRTQLVLEEGPTSVRLQRLAPFRGAAARIAVQPSGVFRDGKYDLFVSGESHSSAELENAPGGVWTPRGAVLRSAPARMAELRAQPREDPVEPIEDEEVVDADGRRAVAMSLGSALELAGALQARGETAQAIDISRQVVAEIAPVLEALALIELTRGRADEAAMLLGAAVLATPEDLTLRLHATKAALAAGRIADARAHAEKALALGPTTALAHDALAAVAYAANAFGDAERELRAALALDTTEPRRWANFATLLELRGDLDGAVAALEGAKAAGGQAALDARLSACRRRMADAAGEEAVDA